MYRLHVFISGHVQGVGLRFAAQQKAEKLGISGWIKNLPDGRVEAVFSGEKEVVEKMIYWCYSESPGNVESIQQDVEKPGTLKGFTIVY